MKSKWYRMLFRRRIYVIALLAIQLAFMLSVIIWSGMALSWVNRALYILSYAVAVYIISQNMKIEYKLIWIFLILLFPIFGGILFLFFHLQSSNKKISRKLADISDGSKHHYRHGCVDSADAIARYPHYENLIRYLDNACSFPAYSDTETVYLSPGEKKYAALLAELEKAEKYIFLEYFIIQSGEMWDSCLEILKRKAALGVDVRVLYDDIGCFLLLPNDYAAYLESYGIKCVVFNKFHASLSSFQNNRDHRKIASIDGKVAFTGGINLADEYINKIDKHGYWKDSSVMLKGAAAWSLTIMFLQMWQFACGEEPNFDDFRPEPDRSVQPDGIVQPYADSPMDNENVGESVYLNIVSAAKHYLYITTPYLVIDDSMLTALKLAAKNGVDVRIITPHRWDKRFVHITTRSYYQELIEAGVKLYEFDGFIHSKTFVSDDKVATVGSINLDFRSLYLHFECGAVLYGSSAVHDVRNDFVNTLDSCFEMNLENSKCNIFARIVREILRLVAPLM